MATKTKRLQTPFADLLPPLSTEEFDALKADIKERGVQDRVWVDEDGNVLDGHHRLKCDPDAPRRVVKGLTPAEKEAFVFKANFVHRNLSPEQKREAKKAMKRVALALRAEDPKKWTQKRIAAALGVAQPTVAAWQLDGMRNIKPDNAHTPDARVKVPKDEKAKIAARVSDGEEQTQVAADYGVAQSTVSRIVSAATQEQEAEKARKESARQLAALKVDGFHEGDFRDVAFAIPDDSVDLIFTDPPYDRESLPLYGDMAVIAAKKLRPGGSLITYLGQYQIHHVIGFLRPHLRLWWTLAVVHSGDAARMREYGVVVKWKPLLWFVRDTRGDKETFVDDLVISTQEKSAHPWQQSVVEAGYYIGNICPPEGTVFDPFCGGGTTAIACKRLGRNFITCDIDAEALAIAKGRFNDTNLPG